MKTEGVMEIPNSKILFIEADHPVWNYVRENPDGAELLKTARTVETHIKANRDGFYDLCDSLQKEWDARSV